jgi:hypothetical protein
MGCGCKKKKPVAKPQNSNTQSTNTQTNNTNGGN